MTAVVTAGLWLPLAASNGQPILELLSGVVLLLSFAVAASLITRFRPRHPVGWLLGVAALGHALVLACSAWVERAGGQAGQVPGWRAALMVEFLLWPVAFHLVPVALLLFPDARLPSRRWRWVLWCNAASASLFGLSRLAPYTLVDAEDGLPAVANPLGVAAAEPLEGLLAPWGLLLTVTWAASAVAAVVRWRRAEGRDRVQMRWLGLGCAGLLLALLSTVGADAAGVPELGDLVVLVVLPALPVAVAVALLRHDLYDVGDVARAVVLEGATAAAVAVVYVGVAAGVATSTSSSPRAAQAAATASALLLFMPLRQLVRETLERRLRGASRRPWDALRRVRADLERSSGDDLLDALAASAASTTRARGVAVDLLEGGVWAEAADHGDCVGAAVEVPVEHRGQLLGRLRVYRRSPGAPVEPAEHRVLSELGSYAGPLLASLRANERLQAAREQLVLAREEERRRVRRDLHDGAGPALAGLALRLSALRSSLPPDDPVVEQVDSLAADVRGVAADLRRLVDGLRPPLLDEVGVTAALRALAQQLAGDALRIEVDGDIGSGAAAVEVAAYRVAAEAMTNVARHSGARSCRVELSRSAGAVEVVVRDDGEGCAPDTAAGTGTESMRQRCDELGGRLRVVSAPGQGTTVHAVLPLATPAVVA